jgi:hypothetical protein
MHIGQDRPNFRRGTRAEDSNCIARFKLQAPASDVAAAGDSAFSVVTCTASRSASHEYSWALSLQPVRRSYEFLGSADIIPTEPTRFTVAMIPPAMMSGQPEFVITMKMAATAVRTFSIASFRVVSQIARIDASPRRKRTIDRRSTRSRSRAQRARGN